MSDGEKLTGLSVRARVIPVPKTISPQAQAFLANADIIPDQPTPAPGDQRA